MTKKEKQPLLEQNLISVLRALDNQIARQMERSPAEREVHGVQKWAPMQDKIEQLVATVMEGVGEEHVRLDSVLILAQAMVKALKLISEELGQEGLGKLRTSYCEDAFKKIESDAVHSLQLLRGGSVLN